MIAYIFQTTICLFGFYLLYMIFLQKETFFQTNRWYIIGTLVASLFIPFLPMLFEQNEVLFTTSLEPVAISINDLSMSLIQDNSASLHWTDILLTIYLIGVALQLTRLAKGLFDIFQLHRNGKRVYSDDISLILTNKPHLPFSFFTTLYVYEDHGLSDVELKKILTHESTHAVEWHSLDILFIEFVGCLLWLNPMIYMYRKLIRDIHEYLADATVLESTSVKMYGQLLLSQKHSGIQLALANNFFNSQLKNRINMMTRQRSNSWSGLKYLAIFPVLFITVSLFSFQKNKFDAKEKQTEDVHTTQNQENFELQNPAELEEITVVGFGTPSNLITPITVKKQSKKPVVPSAKIQEVDEMPVFPGCEDISDAKEKRQCSDKNMLTHVYSNLKYPAEDRKAGISGKAVATFVVSKNGNVKDINIIRSLSPTIDTEIERVITSMNLMAQKWTPGKKDGAYVDVEMTLPVIFKLEDDQKPKPSQKPPYVILISGQEHDPELKVENLNPDDIASIDIRKNATAEDIKKYGANAKYGIITVTMKSGKTIDKSKTPGTALRFEAPPTISKEGEEIFKVVEEMPRFPGCEGQDLSREEVRKCANEKMLRFIYSNIKYPKAAKDNGIEGRNVVQFIVRKDGTITDVKIVRDIGSGTGPEVVRVIKSMNEMPEKWVPGKQRGRVVDVQYTIPISFKLDDQGSSEAEVDHSPVFVVDGKKYDKRFVDEDLKPADIATISVVKNASATEIEKYGMGVKNGIIYITLKGSAVEMQEGELKKFKKQKQAKQRKHPIQKKNTEDVVFKVVEQMPRFPGCEDAGLEGQELSNCAQKKMLEFIYMNVIYPKEARNNGVQGRVVTQFVVEKDGSISNIKIVRSVGSGTDEAVVKVIEDMNFMGEKWIPGKQRGKNVRVQFTLPVSFKLDGQSKKTETEGEKPDADKKQIEVRTNELALTDFSVSPNPSDGKFNIKFVSDPAPLKISVMDMYGKVVYSDEDSNFKGIYNKRLEFSHLANGMYILVVAQNNKTHARHIQIQK